MARRAFRVSSQRCWAIGTRWLHGLLARFDIDATGIAAGEPQACLTGEIDAAPFEGCDTVETFAPPDSRP